MVSVSDLPPIFPRLLSTIVSLRLLLEAYGSAARWSPAAGPQRLPRPQHPRRRRSSLTRFSERNFSAPRSACRADGLGAWRRRAAAAGDPRPRWRLGCGRSGSLGAPCDCAAHEQQASNRAQPGRFSFAAAIRPLRPHQTVGPILIQRQQDSRGEASAPRRFSITTLDNLPYVTLPANRRVFGTPPGVPDATPVGPDSAASAIPRSARRRPGVNPCPRDAVPPRPSRKRLGRAKPSVLFPTSVNVAHIHQRETKPKGWSNCRCPDGILTISPLPAPQGHKEPRPAILGGRDVRPARGRQPATSGRRVNGTHRLLTTR